MKQFTLKFVDPSNDVDFLNTTSITFSFENDNEDSGWRDMFTGARILSSNDKITFHADEQDEAVLKFRFGERLVQL